MKTPNKGAQATKLAARAARKAANPKSLRKHVGSIMTANEAVDQALVNKLGARATNRRARIDAIKSANKVKDAAKPLEMVAQAGKAVSKFGGSRGKVVGALVAGTAIALGLASVGGGGKKAPKLEMSGGSASPGPSKRPSKWANVNTPAPKPAAKAQAPAKQTPARKAAPAPTASFDKSKVTLQARKPDIIALGVADFEAKLKKAGVTIAKGAKK